MADEKKDVSFQPPAGVGSEETTEPMLDKELNLEVERLDSQQRVLYHSLLTRRREELQEQGGGPHNVSVEERWGLLAGIKSGEIRPVKDEEKDEEGGPQLPNVDWEKARKDYERDWPTFIERSLPRGDRD